MSHFCSPKKKWSTEHVNLMSTEKKAHFCSTDGEQVIQSDVLCSPDATKTEKSSGQVSFVQFCSPANQALTYCTVRPF